MSRQSLKNRVSSLCADFSKGSPLPTLLSHFTKDPPPTAIEHGLRDIAPFLGREFTGTDGLNSYFTTVADLLTIESMDFDPEDTWVVDVSDTRGVVHLRGRARFVWKSTQQGWDETFAYRIEGVPSSSAADSGPDAWKVSRYEVWADSGAAYLASKGLLHAHSAEGDPGMWPTNPLEGF
ncbi:hypothetical protein ATERTT37_002960 [Aspergillus terreus]